MLIFMMNLVPPLVDGTIAFRHARTPAQLCPLNPPRSTMAYTQRHSMQSAIIVKSREEIIKSG